MKSLDLVVTVDSAVAHCAGALGVRLGALLANPALVPIWLVAGLILLIALLVIYPALYSMYLATLNKSMEHFVGLDNFSKYGPVKRSYDTDPRYQLVEEGGTHEDDPAGHPHLFTGDSLFPGGVGNTFGDEGAFAQLIDEVETKVFQRLPDDTWFYPGHGNDSTIGAERPHVAEWRTRGW